MNVKVIGCDLKSLRVELAHRETFFCERGALIYYEDGIEVAIDVRGSGIGGALKRAITRVRLVPLTLRNASANLRKLMLAGCSGMLPLDLRAMGSGVICRGGYYIASSAKVDFDFKLNLGSFLGGTGLVMQKIMGLGTVFMDSLGSAVRLDLKAAESIHVDEKSFVCASVAMQAQMSASFSGRGFVSGEGLSMFKVTGPGTVYVNSVNARP